METSIPNSNKPKTKEQIRLEKRADYITNSSDPYLKQLYLEYLKLETIIQIIYKSYNQHGDTVQLMRDDVIRWIAKTEKLMREIYGTKSPEDYEFFRNYCGEIPAYSILPGATISERFVEEYLGSLQATRSHLDGVIDNYIHFEKQFPKKTKISKLDLVLEICKNFPRAVKQLSIRHDKREPFSIKDEYDVQDLLHALLSVHFADIRDEDSCPSFAGVNSRIDFFLKKEGIGIEVKMIRESLLDNKLLPQLTADLKQYQTNPEIKSLIIFIYDPNHLLKNPQAFINDIPEKEGKMEVNVVISPIE